VRFYLALLTALPAIGWAQIIPELQMKVKALESATRAAQSAGDNAWMLVCSALFLMMTGS
jgi:ammonium transporter, Amt family